MADTRRVLVPGQRLAGWVQRFAERNGGYTAAAGGGGNEPEGSLVLTAANGCRAVLTPPLTGTPSTAPASLESLALTASAPRTVGLLLVRRGGYSVGAARGGSLLATKTGTRYVQSRTAAGGWSQQRFARRRANQASALVSTAAEQAAAVWAGHPVDCLQLGGDRQLALEALHQPGLARYVALPMLQFITVPDPRLEVLRRTAADAMSVRITITDAPPLAGPPG